ncbi:MAG: PEP/pyruvate-binding domain-containing protein, partial [Bacteroidota bacterium]
MSKLTQLEQLQALGAPTAPFRGISYADFQAGTYQLDGLAFPVAVRSTFSEEDGATQSFAGHFTTKLQVEQNEVEDAISEVFASYPTPEQQEVIVQQMVQPDYSGVLFAYRGGVWQLEMVEGLGEQLVGGQQTPEQLLLPKFALMDAWMQQYMRVWDSSLPDRASEKAVMQLSYWAGRLNEELDAPHGLDIEFAITNNQLYLLQARPITTPAEKEEVLTSANHKEILPPYPSRLMTDVISESGTALFEYYQDLDPSLGDRAFIKMAAGMPWINLSALLDTMVHWGLPTQLVCDSVGAEDFYRVGLRPYRALRKFGVFWKVLQQQLGVRKSVKQWIATQNRGQQWEQRQREALWESAPAEAFKQWYAAFQKLYVGLVTNMQVLTGAMSGPVGTLNKLGLLTKVSDAAKIKSAST